MSLELVRELNLDHRSMLKIMQEIQAEGNLGPSARTRLEALRELLARHTEREKTSFYPVLRREALSDERIQSTLNVMDGEMAAAAGKIFGFLDTYIGGGSAESFMPDFTAFRSLLTSRIGKEETALYSLFLDMGRLKSAVMPS